MTASVLATPRGEPAAGSAPSGCAGRTCACGSATPAVRLPAGGEGVGLLGIAFSGPVMLLYFTQVMARGPASLSLFGLASGLGGHHRPPAVEFSRAAARQEARLHRGLLAARRGRR